MARQTEDREDLLRDATALVPRCSLRLSIRGVACEVFAGFRQGSALSLYFDTDPVYHFNERRELRRAFVDDRILKAERGQLFLWEPQRTPDETTMQSRPLTVAEQQEFGDKLMANISELRAAILDHRFQIVGRVPVAVDGVGQLQAWLSELNEFKVAHAPGVK